MFQNGGPGPTVSLYDDVLRRAAGRLADGQFPSVDGPEKISAEKTDFVPAFRRHVFL